MCNVKETERKKISLEPTQPNACNRTIKQQSGCGISARERALATVLASNKRCQRKNRKNSNHNNNERKIYIYIKINCNRIERSVHCTSGGYWFGPVWPLVRRTMKEKFLISFCFSIYLCFIWAESEINRIYAVRLEMHQRNVFFFSSRFDVVLLMRQTMANLINVWFTANRKCHFVETHSHFPLSPNSIIQPYLIGDDRLLDGCVSLS